MCESASEVRLTESSSRAHSRVGVANVSTMSRQLCGSFVSAFSRSLGSVTSARSQTEVAMSKNLREVSPRREFRAQQFELPSGGIPNAGRMRMTRTFSGGIVGIRQRANPTSRQSYAINHATARRSTPPRFSNELSGGRHPTPTVRWTGPWLRA